MPGMTPPKTRPRIVAIRLDDLAFSSWRAAIRSLFRKPDLARRKLATASTSNPTGKGWKERTPGTQVGRRANMAVVERIPMTRDVLPERRAMLAAVLRSFGALLSAS